MAPSKIVFVMYHELEIPGRALVQSDPGYVRYILSQDLFRNQMNWLKASGFRGLSVSEALLFKREPSVCITFDDGCETDLIVAAPILLEIGFRATFYLTSGFLDQPGYLSHEQVRQLDSMGFEIGCHSMTHPYLSDLSDAELGREIVAAKQEIEQIVGHSIAHFSCPGGRYDRRTLETARRAGFRTVANSHFHANSTSTGKYELGRVAVLRDTPPAVFEATCQGRGLWNKRLQDRTRQGVRQLLGNRIYDRLRASVLGD
jgi:peptidoglycan/xylan/chitin deacetylase (PgdA/CDA1 family)